MTDDAPTHAPDVLGSMVFKCAICGQTFEKTWSDEEALKEFAVRFVDHALAEADVICETCDRLIFKAGWEYS